MLCLILNKLFYGAAARSIHLIKDIAASSSRSSNIPINYLIILPFYNETSSFFADIWRNKNSAVNSQRLKTFTYAIIHSLRIGSFRAIPFKKQTGSERLP